MQRSLIMEGDAECGTRGDVKVLWRATDVRIGSGTLCIVYEWQQTSLNSGEKALGNVPQIKFPNVRKSN